jgi:hydroxymethylglutaryl-CoA lyase
VFLLESLGFETGIDIEKLIAVRADVETWLPGERFFGMVARAGLPKTFHHAAAA